MKNYIKKISIIIFLIFISFSLISCKKQENDDDNNYVDYFDGYYSNLVSWTDGEDLKRQLNIIIRNGFTSIAYDSWLTDFSDRSHWQTGYLDVVYSDTNIVAGYDSNRIHAYNKEHAWPQSYFKVGDKAANRKSDYHNLFSSPSNANNARGNTYYAFVSGGNLAQGSTSCYLKNNAFEPCDNDKGRLARAIFYMATMYMPINSDGTAFDKIKGLTIVNDMIYYGNECCMGILDDLLAFSSEHYVDYLELQHNEVVYAYKINSKQQGTATKAQGNRNPYIDFPELVEYAFGSKKNESGKLTNLTCSYKTLSIDRDYVINNSFN